MRPRNHAASAGLDPEVETAIVTGSPAVHRRKQERAVRGVVGAVHPDPGLLSVLRHRPVHLRHSGSGHDQPVVGGLARLGKAGAGRLSGSSSIAAIVPSDGEHPEGLMSLGGDHGHRRPAGEKRPGLSPRDVPAAHDQAPACRRPPGRPGRSGSRCGSFEAGSEAGLGRYARTIGPDPPVASWVVSAE